jgi:uncharacterized protein (DUF1330 family)
MSDFINLFLFLLRFMGAPITALRPATVPSSFTLYISLMRWVSQAVSPAGMRFPTRVGDDARAPSRRSGPSAYNAKAFRKYGARFLARGGKSNVVEGHGRSRVVVIEFKDYTTALDCYRSPEYAKAMALRKDKGVADIIVTEGYDGPQPTD